MSRGEARKGRPQGPARENRGRPERAAGAVPMGSLGAWLRSQREARGVSIRDIAEATKISQRYLEALESDRFDALPAEVFVRGFLREYARIVGLDPDEVVNVYLLAAEAARPEPREDEPPPAGGRRSSAVAYGVLIAALLVALLGTAAALSYWWGRGRSAEPSKAPDSSSVARPPANESRPAAPATPGEASEGELPATPSVEPPAPSVEPTAPGVESTAPSVEPPATRPETAPPPEATSSPEAAGEQPLRVVLEFQQDCWVELVVDGRRRESELKAGGETWAIEARESVVLTLGNAPAVRVEVDGRPVRLPTGGTRVVREFRIDRSTVESGVAEPAVDGA